jgi:transposase-like protein
MVSQRNSKAAASGGPQTAAGKRASRRNALKHGLTSRRLLPDVLRKEQVNEHRVAFTCQYQPANPTESVLVAEMSRHAVMMELGEHAEGAVLRHGVRELSKIIPGATEGTSGDSNGRADAVLAAAVSTDALEKCNRYRRGHEKAFFAALNALREIQSQRQRRENINAAESATRTSPWVTEEDCEEHLAQRFRRDDWNCPHCQSTKGSWLQRQKRWECSACRRQVGLRYGTVMQGSRLPLRIWFLAIREMRKNPNVSTSQMMNVLGMQRRGTVRSLMTSITRAMAANDASEVLAGMEAP